MNGVLISLTGLQVIIGELVPKSIARQYPTRTALLTAVPMRASLWLLRWFIAMLNVGLNVVGNGIMGLLGMSRQTPFHRALLLPGRAWQSFSRTSWAPRSLCSVSSCRWRLYLAQGPSRS